MLRSFLLLLVAAATVHGQYTCDSVTGFPIITEANRLDVENTNLFPPHLDTAGSGFKTTAGRFRVGVVTSKFYTAALTVDNNDPTVNGGADYTEGSGSTAVSFYPLGAATQPVALGTGVTNDDFNTIDGQTQAEALAAVTTHPEGTLNTVCHEYKSVSIDWSLLVATVDYEAVGVTGLDGVNRDAGTYPGAVRFRGAVQVLSTTTLRGTIFQIGAGAAYTKTADDLLFYQVNFPTQVTVQFANLLVYAEVTVQVVVTSHVINLVSLNVANANPTVTATITFATTVQMPFRIQDTQDILAAVDMASVGINAGITGAIGGVLPISGSTCDDDSTLTCTQNWSITTGTIQVATMAAAQGGDCGLDAQFTVDFDVVCQPSAGTSCPLQNDYEEQFQFQLKSASLCPTVVVDVQWDVYTLVAYQDNAFTTVRTAFRVDDTAYFKAVVSSDTNAAVMSGCDVVSISSTVSPSPSVALYNRGPAGSGIAGDGGAGPETNCNTLGTGCWVTGVFDDGQITANQCNVLFGIKLIAAAFNVPRFQSLTHSIAAVIQVDFAGFKKLKRVQMMQSDETAEASPMADIEIQSLEIETGEQEVINGGEAQAGDSQTIILENQGSDMFIYIIIGVCAFVALLIGALVIYLRRSKKEKKVQNAITPQIQVQMQPQHGYVTQHTVGMAATA